MSDPNDLLLRTRIGINQFNQVPVEPSEANFNTVALGRFQAPARRPFSPSKYIAVFAAALLLYNAIKLIFNGHARVHDYAIGVGLMFLFGFAIADLYEELGRELLEAPSMVGPYGRYRGFFQVAEGEVVDAPQDFTVQVVVANEAEVQAFHRAFAGQNRAF